MEMKDDIKKISEEIEKEGLFVQTLTSEINKAYSCPGEDYKEILEIHDGAELKIREERNGYYLIQLPGGIGGWVKTEGVEKVFP